MHENKFCEMLNATTGELLPAAEWTGMLPEMLVWISAQAGFTYTLSPPSGNGSACHAPVGDTPSWLAYATQYQCAEADVTELGISDVYMGVFYVTQPRLEQGLMTTPFDGHAGLALFQVEQTSTFAEYIALQARGLRGAACTLRGAAFSDWLTDNQPNLSTRLVSYDEYVPSVVSGACDAFVVDYPVGDILAAKTCSVNLVGGTPLEYGLHDYAWGVATGREDLREGLSYWISYLRSCSTLDRTSACFSRFNLFSLTTRWTTQSDCQRECPPGFEWNDERKACNPCALGQFKPAVGNDGRCTACPPGTYQPTTGGSSCLPCPAGTHQQYAGEPACKVCELPTSAPPGASLCDVCAAGYMRATATTAPSSISCHACPTGALCALNTTVATLQISPGHWRVSSDADAVYPCTTTPNGVTPCLGSNASVGSTSDARGGNTTDASGPLCWPGHTGPLCEVCASPGFYFSRASASCERCPMNSSVAGTAAAASTICGLLLLFAYKKKKLLARLAVRVVFDCHARLRTRHSWGASVVGCAGCYPALERLQRFGGSLVSLHTALGMRAKLKIVFAFYSIVVVLEDTYDVRVPAGPMALPTLETSFKWISIDRVFSFMPSTCLASTPSEAFQIWLLLLALPPLGIVLLVAAYKTVGIYAASRSAARKTTKAAAIAATTAATTAAGAGAMGAAAELVGSLPAAANGATLSDVTAHPRVHFASVRALAIGVLPTCVLVAFVFLPTVSGGLFLSWSCVRYRATAGRAGSAVDEYVSFLRADPAIQCSTPNHYSEAHEAIKELAWPLVIVWPVGMLLLCAALLVACRRALLRRQQTPLVAATRFLHADYDPGWFYWEGTRHHEAQALRESAITSTLSCVLTLRSNACACAVLELLRRTILTGWVLLVETEHAFLRLLIGLLISLASLAALLAARPYTRPEDSLLAGGVHLALVLLFELASLCKLYESVIKDTSAAAAASILGVPSAEVLVLPMLVVAWSMLLLLLFVSWHFLSQNASDRVLKLRSNRQMPTIRLPEGCRWALCLSHDTRSPAAREAVATVRDELQRLLPGIPLCATDDDEQLEPSSDHASDSLDTASIAHGASGEGGNHSGGVVHNGHSHEARIAQSACVVLFVTPEALASAGCVREMVAATAQKRPLVLMHALEDRSAQEIMQQMQQAGGMSAHTSMASADEFVRRDELHHCGCDDSLAAVIFASDRETLQWHRDDDFRIATLTQLATFTLSHLPPWLAGQTRPELYLPGAGTSQPPSLPPGTTLYTSPSNAGARELAEALQAAYPSLTVETSGLPRGAVHSEADEASARTERANTLQARGQHAAVLKRTARAMRAPSSIRVLLDGTHVGPSDTSHERRRTIAALLPARLAPHRYGKGHTEYQLLYLTRETTFTGPAGEALCVELRQAYASRAPIVVAHECDPQRQGCALSELIRRTPNDLLCLYTPAPVPFHTGAARAASLVRLVSRLGAVAASKAGTKSHDASFGRRPYTIWRKWLRASPPPKEAGAATAGAAKQQHNSRPPPKSGLDLEVIESGKSPSCP